MDELPIKELRAKIRKPGLTCQGCEEHSANDVHHLDGNHKNNEPGNLAAWCKRCHNEHHGISDNLTELGILVEQYNDIQKVRMAMANRVAAYERLGYSVVSSQAFLDDLQTIEGYVSKAIKEKIKTEELYTVWLKQVKGIGHTLSAKLIHIIGSVDKFETVSSLWAYGGVDVREGKARKKRKGEQANWNPALRALICELIPDQFVKVRGSFGRKLYDEYKAYYQARDGETLSKLHIERRTRRKVGKVFIACLWARWRELEGLPVNPPYALGLENHSHLVTPNDWLEQPTLV